MTCIEVLAYVQHGCSKLFPLRRGGGGCPFPWRSGAGHGMLASAWPSAERGLSDRGERERGSRGGSGGGVREKRREGSDAKCVTSVRCSEFESR